MGKKYTNEGISKDGGVVFKGTPPELAVRTQDEVARLMGLSCGRVQQLERSALQKIRLALMGQAIR